MVSGHHAFVTHPFSGGFSVLAVHDPRAPHVVAHVPARTGTLTLHLQLCGDLLLVTNEVDRTQFEAFRDRARYFSEQLGNDVTGGYRGGIQVYDVSKPAAPRLVGGCELPGFGVHRLWWTGGDRALASAMPPDQSDFILATLNMSDPLAPHLVNYWAPEELTPGSPTHGGRLGLHHAIQAGPLAYGAWREGGLQIVDVSSDAPRRVGRLLPETWGGGNTHTTLPLPGRGLVVVLDESVQDHGADGDRRIWLVDVTEPTRPAVIAALPEPSEQDFRALGGVFGPHNLNENRPGAWQSETLLFATYQNAGVRAYDISDAQAPIEVGHFVPSPPSRIFDPRASGTLVAQSADLIATDEGVVIVSDFNAGLTFLQFEG